MDGYSLLENLTVPALYEVFPDQDDMPEVRAVSSELIPAPYRSLLVHTSHMTVTVEKYFQESVDIDVLSVVETDDAYARKILLKLQSSGKVVQFGIVHIDLKVLAEPVREQILSKRTPLGRVLIENDVLRDVRPTGFFQVTPSPKMCEWFGLSEPTPTYGRLGVIYTDNNPAIQVAEILAPIGVG